MAAPTQKPSFFAQASSLFGGGVAVNSSGSTPARNGAQPAPAPARKQTWKEYSGRTTGPDGYVLGDLTRRQRDKVKNQLVDGIKERVLRVLQQAYIDKVKPQLTSEDKHMPMAVRRAIHEVADEFWETLSLELPSLIDRMLAVVQDERAQRSEAAGAASMLGGVLLDRSAPSVPSPPPSPPSTDLPDQAAPAAAPAQSAAAGTIALSSNDGGASNHVGGTDINPAQATVVLTLELACGLEALDEMALVSGLATMCTVPTDAVSLDLAGAAAAQPHTPTSHGDEGDSMRDDASHVRGGGGVGGGGDGGSGAPGVEALRIMATIVLPSRDAAEAAAGWLVTVPTDVVAEVVGHPLAVGTGGASDAPPLQVHLGDGGGGVSGVGGGAMPDVAPPLGQSMRSDSHLESHSSSRVSGGGSGGAASSSAAAAAAPSAASSSSATTATATATSAATAGAGAAPSTAAPSLAPATRAAVAAVSLANAATAKGPSVHEDPLRPWVFVTRYVRLHWPSTKHADYQKHPWYFCPGIHAQLVGDDGRTLLLPPADAGPTPTRKPSSSSKPSSGGGGVGAGGEASGGGGTDAIAGGYRVLKGGPALTSQVLPAKLVPSEALREKLAHGAQRLTFWRRSIEEIAFGKRGVLGHMWGELTVEIDFGEVVHTRGVRSDSRLPFKVEFSLDGQSWTTSAAFYHRDAAIDAGGGGGRGKATSTSRRCCGIPCGGGAGSDGRHGDGGSALASFGGALQRARSWLVYSYLPFDLSLFGRLRAPNALLVQMVALCPVMWVRGLFFTVLLGCFLVEPEEHTLMKFILGLK